MPPKRRSGRGGDMDTQEAKKTKTGPVPGDMCPDFELETDSSTSDAKRTLSLKELVADSGVVIFFYPKANTGGCTTQACGFNDNYDKLVAAGYKVCGMSADKPASQAKWKAKHSFKYALLSDPTFEVMTSLGVTKGNKKINRSHIIVEKGGRIKAVKIGISPKNSVLEAVTALCPENKGSGKEAPGKEGVEEVKAKEASSDVQAEGTAVKEVPFDAEAEGEDAKGTANDPTVDAAEDDVKGTSNDVHTKGISAKEATDDVDATEGADVKATANNPIIQVHDAEVPKEMNAAGE